MAPSLLATFKKLGIKVRKFPKVLLLMLPVYSQSTCATTECMRASDGDESPGCVAMRTIWSPSLEVILDSWCCSSCGPASRRQETLIHSYVCILTANFLRKVVLPLALGQLARLTPLRRLHERKPKAISRLSECVLLSIIYTTFCDTFASNTGVKSIFLPCLSLRDRGQHLFPCLSSRDRSRVCR